MKVKLVLKAFLNSILPPLCPLCDEVVEKSPHLCREGEFLWRGASCIKCAKPFGTSTDEQWLCGECMTRNRYFSKVFSAFLYRGILRKRLLEFKYMKRTAGIRSISEVLAMKISEHPLLPEVFIPVPMSEKRLRERGFNHSALIAKTVGKMLGIPVDYEILIRKENTPPLYNLTRKERFDVLKNAFSLTGNPPYRRVCLIDDIMTTGATIEACAKTLLKGGVEEVYAGVIARD